MMTCVSRPQKYKTQSVDSLDMQQTTLFFHWLEFMWATSEKNQGFKVALLHSSNMLSGLAWSTALS